jgi:hypothetical protein
VVLGVVDADAGVSVHFVNDVGGDVDVGGVDVSVRFADALWMDKIWAASFVG